MKITNAIILKGKCKLQCHLRRETNNFVATQLKETLATGLAWSETRKEEHLGIPSSNIKTDVLSPLAWRGISASACCLFVPGSYGQQHNCVGLVFCCSVFGFRYGSYSASPVLCLYIHSFVVLAFIINKVVCK